jgi:cellulose synthase/poly-beta-1,6-N-acetylglucosamine synthase-like glycosyltransferase
LSKLTSNDVFNAKHHYRNNWKDGTWEPAAQAQQAGLAALISIAQRIQADSEDSAYPDWDRAIPQPKPAWVAADAPPEAAALDALAGVAPVQRQAGAGRGQVTRRPIADTAAMAIQISRLSVGRVEKTTRYGPVISPSERSRRLRKSTFRSELSTGDRVVAAFFSLMWVICLVSFWYWWLEPSHQTTLYSSILNGLVLAYLTCFPVFFVVAVNRLRNVNRHIPVPKLRVAFIVTRAPSEPWPVAKATLTAMLDQEFPLPYDVWLADESPTEEILEWCSQNWVIVSTRDGVEEYHRPTWPRRTKCKEGNLAFFYDHWGYRSYDVVVQLDCDHIPSPTYLTEMVKPFADPAVGYVSAPSICDTNAAESWSARGRLYAEATFHGAFQLGHSAGWSPLCIGSHYAVRTAALRDIGGIGPELAEDFSTTFLLNTAGWHGAFAINAEAHGDGPGTFAAMLVQEFQWSKSLTVLLLKLVPRNLTKLDWAHRFRFIYALLFYLLLTISTLVGVLLAPIAAVTGKPWMNVNYLAFLVHWWSLSIWLILLAVLLKRRGLLRPTDAPIFSWENWLYILVRWPYITRGVCSAFIYAIRPRAVTFKVTPKGSGELESLPTRLLVPYLLISLLGSVPAIIAERTDDAAGYVFLCLLGAITYSLVCMLVALLHAKEMTYRVKVSMAQAIRRTSLLPMLLGMFTLVPAIYAAMQYPAYFEHVYLGWNLHTALANWHWQSLF